MNKYTVWIKERIWSIFRFFNRFCFSKQQTKGAATPIILRNCVSTFTPTNYHKSTAPSRQSKGKKQSLLNLRFCRGSLLNFDHAVFCCVLGHTKQS